MPQTCKACKHPHREEIDSALTAGESFRHIAKRFHISSAAAFRHKAHVCVSIVKAAERREERLGENRLDELHWAKRKNRELAGKAEAEGDYRCAIVALREYRECVNTEEEIVFRAMKLQAQTDPASLEIRIIDISAEPASPTTP